MVSKVNVSAYVGTPTASGTLKIPGGPLYKPDQVLQMLEKGEEVFSLWTNKCISDAKKYQFEMVDIAGLIKSAISSNGYRDSEWCEQKPGGPWAACDAYSFSRHEWSHVAYKEIAFDYFVKFAISKTGSILLIVSCHPPEER